MDKDTVQTEEGWLTTPDGHKLYTKMWMPNTAPKARVVCLHGFSDHCNMYPFLFSSLAQEGIKVYSFDQRGWGRSVHEPRQRGLTGPTEQVMEDLTTFITALPQSEQDVPLFLMGHSMGGGEAIVYTATGPREVVSRIRGVLLDAPFISLPPSEMPWKSTIALGRLASRFMPHRPLLQKLDSSSMCRDPDVCQAWLDDPLCHDTGTLEGLAGFMDRSFGLKEGRILLEDGLCEGGKTRLWVGHGTKDGLADYTVTRQWYEGAHVDDKELRTYEGWYHKLHSEPGEDKVRFARDVATWVLDRAGPLSDVKSKL
ncbi:hypothetical protein LTR37_002163 [Vermiconidia calcicola]|uniref:Uncharacterized protein n=1 Tax=Vermiconidia calcicola TaxID=1690605 RepID=A0ACC3NTT2_9PEZI|nr:hypothetical protein LTR37_002163 [Vermiconidia calcicola]